MLVDHALAVEHDDAESSITCTGGKLFFSCATAVDYDGGCRVVAEWLQSGAGAKGLKVVQVL